MPEDLPPGVKGPVPDPTVEGYKQLFENDELFPVFQVKSIFNPLPLMTRFAMFTIDGPATMIRGFLDKMNMGSSGRRYYHQKYRRVPNIWECPLDDNVCIYEAEMQFRRDKSVDTEILEIFENKQRACKVEFPSTWSVDCKEHIDRFYDLDYAWKVKYADLGLHLNAREALNKQKNRFIEERYKKRMGIVDEEGRYLKTMFDK